MINQSDSGGYMFRPKSYLENCCKTYFLTQLISFRDSGDYKMD